LIAQIKSLLSCFLLSALLAFGCGSDDESSGPTDPDKGHPPEEMLGSWTFRSVTVDGAAADLSDVMDWVPSAVEAHIQVLENGAYVYEEVDSRGGQLWFESGFVYVEGGEIDVNLQLDGDGRQEETSFLSYTLSAGIFTLQENDKGTVTVFTLTM